MQASLVFRPLPAPLVAKVLKTFRKDAGWSDEDNTALDRALNPGSQLQWATVDSSSKTIGIVRLELAPPQFCYVSNLIILSKYRGQGVGQWLINNIERYCQGLGIPRMLLQPLENNRGFYEKLHFVADPYVAGFLKKEISPFQRKILPFYPAAAGKAPKSPTVLDR
jgi:ribosomal protein S18 acetylase RimI-like enzyme